MKTKVQKKSLKKVDGAIIKAMKKLSIVNPNTPRNKKRLKIYLKAKQLG